MYVSIFFCVCVYVCVWVCVCVRERESVISVYILVYWVCVVCVCMCMKWVYFGIFVRPKCNLAEFLPNQTKIRLRGGGIKKICDPLMQG